MKKAKPLFVAAIAVCAFASPTAAIAGDGAQSAQFTVTIPPIAEALEASRTGAAGLWTVKGSRGLMIAVAERQGKASAIRIFAREKMAYSVTWSSSGSTPERTQSRDFTNDTLDAQNFNVPKTAGSVETFTLSAI